LLRTRNARMTAILKSAKRVAPTSATVLLIGESGVGKRLLARQIHQWSLRRDRPLIVIDCASISKNLIKAESLELVSALLTGMAATDGTHTHADEPGTVFLDNVSDLEFEAQAKLLDFVDAQRLGGVSGNWGGSGTRIIASSRSELASEVQAKKFRADFFYRISVIPLRIPPLRQRPEDIFSIAKSLLRDEAVRYGRPHLQFSSEARLAIRHRSWLGNALELSSVIESAVVLCGNDLITRDDISKSNGFYVRSDAPTAAPQIAATLRDVERNRIAAVLSSGVTAEEAANILGISSSTLYRRRKEYSRS
jgi:DNA-binding NtrC family response regulator